MPKLRHIQGNLVVSWSPSCAWLPHALDALWINFTQYTRVLNDTPRWRARLWATVLENGPALDAFKWERQFKCQHLARVATYAIAMPSVSFSETKHVVYALIPIKSEPTNRRELFAVQL